MRVLAACAALLALSVVLVVLLLPSCSVPGPDPFTDELSEVTAAWNRRLDRGEKWSKGWNRERAREVLGVYDRHGRTPPPGLRAAAGR